jgi:hypothetical protein
MSEVEQDIAELKRCRVEIAKNGYASATMSSGGGSRSYTRLDLSKITEAISSLTSELKKLRNMLKDIGSQTLWQNVLVVYDL